MTPMYI
jgi:hypothetical protein